MIRDLTIVNYCNRIYELYINEDILYLKEGNTFLKIASSIKDYKVSYLDNILWIACKKKEHISVYKVVLNTKEDIQLSIGTIIDYKSIYKNIIEIALIVDKNNNSLIVSAQDTVANKGYIFEIKLFDKITTNIISSCDVQALNVLEICSIGKKIYVLICRNRQKGEYTLYDMLEEKYVRSVNVGKAQTVKMLNFKDKILLGHWEEGVEYREIKFVQLIPEAVAETNIVNSVKLYKEIKEPIIFSYLSKIYILLRTKNTIYLYYCKDNKNWLIKELNNSSNMKPTVMLKVIRDIAWEFISYTEIDEDKYIFNFIEEKHYYINNRDKIKRLENQKLKMLHNILEMDKYYANICSKYTEKITSLIKLIDEKDEIITNLLEIK